MRNPLSVTVLTWVNVIAHRNAKRVDLLVGYWYQLMHGLTRMSAVARFLTEAGTSVSIGS